MSDQLFKADAGKRRPTLFQVGFAIAVRLVQATMEYGGVKYEAHSWRKVPNARERYFEAAERHRQDRMLWLQHTPDDHLGCTDPESGLPHIAHEVFNLMALMELSMSKSIDLEKLCQFKHPPQDHKMDPIGNDSPLRRHCIPVPVKAFDPDAGTPTMAASDGY